jgi:D-alanine-D-alanine ligase
MVYRTSAAQSLPEGLPAYFEKLSKRIYRALSLNGYARIDFRMRPDGSVFVLEANANPNLSYGEDFAESAHLTGLEYGPLLGRIINLGLNYQSPWRLQDA